MTTKEKLVASALKLFNEKWFENTSTTSICTDAGFSSGALFVHFKTKNELLDSIYVDIKKKYFSNIFDWLDSNLEISEKFREIMRKSFDFYLKNYESYTFVKNFSNSLHISRVAREEVELEMEAFASVYEEWKEKGIFNDWDFGLILSAISWMFYSMVEYVKNNKNISIDECIDFIMKVVLK